MDSAAVAVLKRPAEQQDSDAPIGIADTADTIPEQSKDDISGSCIITNGLQAAKRQKPSPTVDRAAAAGADNHPADQSQHKVPEQQDRSHLHHDRSHLRKQHAATEDAEADGSEQQQQQQPGQQLGDDQQRQQQPQHNNAAEEHGQQQQHQQQQQQQREGPDRPPAAAVGSHPHKHKRHNQQAHKHNLLSFEEELEGFQEEVELLAESAAAAAAAEGSSNLTQQQQQFGGGLGKATAAKFAAESRAAAVVAARATLQPVIFSSSSGSNAGGGGGQQQQQGGLVDEDEPNGLRRQAPASLSRIHFGMSQARGARPYMEDRHCIVTALKPSSTTAATGHDSHAHPSSDGTAAAAADGSPRLTPPHDQQQQQQQQQQHVTTGVVQDGVERCYAAIFDGHNGAGAAETAARQLHLLLASHPALKIYKGDPGPPAVVRQEEAAVGKALKAAFRQVDDLVLAVARRDGTRDGATALVVLRLGGVLYAAHAGDSRAVLCREGQAYRLTEDHKPHLPQERQRIEDAGGRVDFQRCWRVVVEPRDGRPGSGLAVSRSLGDLDFKEPARFVECDPDVTRLPLLPHKDSFVILGSDGLWDVLSDTDAVATAAAALKAYTQEHQRSSSHARASEAAVECATELYRHHQHYNSGSTMSLPWQQQYNSSSGQSYGGVADQLQQQQRGLSDGVDAGQFMYTDGAATAAAEALLAESMRRGTMDNVTVIVMLLQWE